MAIKKIGGKDNVLELEISDVSPAYVNTLRRAIMNEVPTLAIESCEIRRNSSVMYDEMLAHRMGLLPLTTPVGDYALPSDDEMEKQEFSARSSVKATLVAKGPCTVYAKDLKFADAKVKPVYPNTPLLKLLEGQEVQLEALAVLGRGRVHAKWSPGLVYYHEIPSLKGKSLPVAPEYKQGVSHEQSKDFEARTGNYYFRVESWGQIAPQEMLTLVFDELNASLKEFDALLKA